MTLPPGILSLPNGQWVLEHDSHLSRWAEQHGTIVSDPHLMKWLKARIPTTVKVAWSVGANIGDHARQFADWGLQVVAIEPNPTVCACLVHNVPEATCFNLAASDVDGSLNFAVAENVGASRISESGEWSVEAKRLDDLGLPDPDLIVIDVEGWELHALRGMQETIRRCKPVILCEVNRGALAANGHDRFDLGMFFKNLGYPSSGLSIYPPGADPEGEQYDWLLQP